MFDIAVALGFGVALWAVAGSEAAIEYYGRAGP